MRTFCFTILILILPVSLYASFVPVTSDLWDMSKGTIVTGTSGVYGGSNVYNMFGATIGVEPGNMLFKDWMPDRFIHWVEWKTDKPIRLTSFNLLAAHDGGNRDANYRGFRSFTLKYQKPDGSWQNYYSYRANYPLYNPAGGPGDFNMLYLSATILPFCAQYFRAEFEQCGATPWASGPRILELDGFGSVAVPEPATASMIITGLLSLGLAGVRFRRR